MIFRIHHDDRFLTFEIPTREVLNKLGREHPFHINRAPISYIRVWKDPLHILFFPPEDNSQIIVPDLAEVDGKLFLSEKAYSVLENVIDGHGEFLPVTYDGGKGYILNILTIAEDMNGVDENLTGYDNNGNLEHFCFREEIMEMTPIFRTKIDDYQGIFCNEKMKSIIVNAGITGVLFHNDPANPLGENYGTSH